MPSSLASACKAITADIKDGLSLMLSGEIPFQPNPQKAELEAPEAPHTGSITSFKRYFNTENRKAFVVGLFKPGSQVVEEKEKLPLISCLDFFFVLHTPYLL